MEACLNSCGISISLDPYKAHPYTLKTRSTHIQVMQENICIMFEERCFKRPAASAVAGADSGDVGGASSGFCTGSLNLKGVP